MVKNRDETSIKHEGGAQVLRGEERKGGEEGVRVAREGLGGEGVMRSATFKIFIHLLFSHHSYYFHVITLYSSCSSNYT